MNINKELNELIAKNITAIVELADRCGEDRDEVLARYARLIAVVSEVGTLKSYEVNGGN